MSSSGRQAKASARIKEKAKTSGPKARLSMLFSKSEPKNRRATLAPVVEERGTAIRVPSSKTQAPSPIVQTRITALAQQEQLRQRQAISHNSKTPHAEADPDPSSSSKNQWIGIALLLLMVGLISMAGLENSKEGKAPQAAVKTQTNPAELAERVQFHRMQTGTRINRERISAEYLNQQMAPSLSESDHKVRAPDMMAGVPLGGETHHRADDYPRNQIVNPNDPDARIMYSLQEEQDADEWERRATKQYIDDFVKNAAEQGYKVQVDRGYNVKVLQRLRERDPSSEAKDGAIR